MAVARKSTTEELFVNKAEIQRLVVEQSEIMGIPDDPTATPQKARAMMVALGIRAEDNEFSRGIIAAREE
jgi:DNA gyrase inhibitor GyrI